jgi:hypothetical protein
MQIILLNMSMINFANNLRLILADHYAFAKALCTLYYIIKVGLTGIEPVQPDFQSGTLPTEL